MSLAMVGVILYTEENRQQQKQRNSPYLTEPKTSNTSNINNPNSSNNTNNSYDKNSFANSFIKIFDKNSAKKNDEKIEDNVNDQTDDESNSTSDNHYLKTNSSSDNFLESGEFDRLDGDRKC